MRFEEDAWLSSVMSRRCWKLHDIRADDVAPSIRRELRDLPADAPCFVFTKIPTRDVIALTNATLAGFSVVDVNVTFDWIATADPKAVKSIPGDGLGLRIATSDDAPGIEDVAARCFTYSRFHLDPRIEASMASSIKREWARHASAGRAAEVYVAGQNGSVGGFLAVLEIISPRGSDAIIDLVGVDARYQSQGVGRALSRMFIERWKNRASRLRVGTQISNIPAMRLYESLGFQIAETAYVLHAHTQSGEILT